MTTWKLKLTAAVAAGLIGVAGIGTYVAMGQSGGPGGRSNPPVRSGPSTPQVDPPSLTFLAGHLA